MSTLIVLKTSTTVGETKEENEKSKTNWDIAMLLTNFQSPPNTKQQSLETLLTINKIEFCPFQGYQNDISYFSITSKH